MKRFLLAIIAVIFAAQAADAQIYTAATWWNTPPEEWQFFAGADVVLTDEKAKPAFGVRVGAVKNFGGYFRLALNGMNKDCKYMSNSGYDVHNNYYVEDPHNPKSIFRELAVGGMMRLWSPFYLNLGVGMGSMQYCWKLMGSSDYVGLYDDYEGEFQFGGEAGLSFRINDLMINATYSRFGEDIGTVSFGVSYCF